MRLTKQLVYGIVILIILGLIGWGIVSSLYNPVPTCTDNRRNQGETDIDCGGPCQSCEQKNLQPSRIISKRAFRASDGFGYVIELANPNSEWAAVDIPYTVTIKDSFGKNIYEKSGTTFAYAGELKYIVEPYLKGNFQSIASIDVALGKHQWRQKTDMPRPLVDAQDIRTIKDGATSTQAGFLTVNGKLVNQTSLSYQGPKILAIVYNRSGAAISASQTQLESIGALETKEFSIQFSREMDLFVPAIAPKTQFSKNLSFGQTDPDVTTLQQILQELGLLDRNPTGFYDSTTQQAVRTLQERNDFEETGEFNDETRNYINSLLQSQVEQPSQEQNDTGVDPSKTKVFVEIMR